MSGIFISYRRGDSGGHAGRIHDLLVAHFGADLVHIDVDTIKPGDDFAERIATVLAASQVSLVVISPGWLGATDQDGNWRLGSAEDFVRLEIETALQNNVPIFPTLVGDADMPRSEDLPESIRPLARRQAAKLTDVRWDFDWDRLVRALESQLKEPKWWWRWKGRKSREADFRIRPEE